MKAQDITRVCSFCKTAFTSDVSGLARPKSDRTRESHGFCNCCGPVYFERLEREMEALESKAKAKAH